MTSSVKSYHLDEILSKINETQLLDQSLSALSASVHQSWQQIFPETCRRQDCLTQRLIGVDNKIDAFKENVLTLFGSPTASPDLKCVHQLTSDLEGLYKALYRDVRTEAAATLEALAKQRGLIQGMFDELDRANESKAQILPEQITLVTRNDGLPVPGGQSIFDIESSGLEESARHSPFPLVSRIRVRIHYRYLKRLYRVSEPRPRNAAMACLHRADRLGPSSFLCQFDRAKLDAQGQFDGVWNDLRHSFLESLADLEDLYKLDQPDSSAVVEARVTEARNTVTAAIDSSVGQFSRLALPFSAVLEDLNAAIIKDLEDQIECTRQSLLATSKPPRPAQRLKRWLHRCISYPVGTLSLRVLGWTILVKNAPKSLKSRLGDLISLVRAASGPPATPQEALLGVTELPSRADLDIKLDRFPPLYQRLFSPHPLELRELLIGGDEELHNMTEAYNTFLAGAPVNLAVIGSQGGGKTSLINCFIEETNRTTPIRRSVITRRLRTESELIEFMHSCFELNESSSSVSELTSRLQRLPRQLVILEGGHNLFVKAVAAREAAESFLQVMMSTRINLMWCVGFHDVPWVQMDHVLQISRYFSHEIKAGLGDSQSLQEALMLRVFQCGLSPVFLPDDPVPLDEANQQAAGDNFLVPEEQEQIRERYFRDLFRITGGNFASARYFWQLSCDYIEASDELRISPCVNLNSLILQSLDRVHLFTVAEILKHGGLTLKEHSELFNMDTRDSQLILTYLSQLPLVQSVTIELGCPDELYEVNPIYYHHTSAYLSSLNILH